MQKQISNPCTRCGNERIISKSWEETVKTFYGTTMVVHTLTVCPNRECQKIVEEQLATQRIKQEIIRRDKEAKIADRRKRATVKKEPQASTR